MLGPREVLTTLGDLGDAFQVSDAQGLLTIRLPRYESKLARRRERVIEVLLRTQSRRRAADAHAAPSPVASPSSIRDDTTEE